MVYRLSTTVPGSNLKNTNNSINLIIPTNVLQDKKINEILQKKTMPVQFDILIHFLVPVRLRTSCLRWGSGTRGVGSSLKKSLRTEATVGTSCSCSRSTLSPLSHRCLSCLVLTTEPHRRNRPLCCIPGDKQTKRFSQYSQYCCALRE